MSGKIKLDKFLTTGYEPYNEPWYNYTRELRDEFAPKEVLLITSRINMYDQPYKDLKTLETKIYNMLIKTIKFILDIYKDTAAELLQDIDDKYIKLYFKNDVITDENIEEFRMKYLKYMSRGILGVMLLNLASGMVANNNEDEALEEMMFGELLVHMLSVMNVLVPGLEEDMDYMHVVMIPNLTDIYKFITKGKAMDVIRVLANNAEATFGKRASFSGIVDPIVNKDFMDTEQEYFYIFTLFDLTYL